MSCDHRSWGRCGPKHVKSSVHVIDGGQMQMQQALCREDGGAMMTLMLRDLELADYSKGGCISRAEVCVSM